MIARGNVHNNRNHFPFVMIGPLILVVLYLLATALDRSQLRRPKWNNMAH